MERWRSELQTISAAPTIGVNSFLCMGSFTVSGGGRNDWDNLSTEDR
jgi:hypothetical protein